MRTSILAVALVAALLVVGAGGATAASGPVQPQQATTTANTTDGAGMTTSTETSTAAGATSVDAGEVALTFEDQNGSGETVSVRSVTLPRKGFVVINGTPNGTEQVLGASYLLNAGTSDNVRVELDRSISGSQSLTAVLYADSNDNGQFDPPSASGESDEPIRAGDSNGRVVDIAQFSTQNASNGQTGTTGGTATSAGNETSATRTATEEAGTTAANESGGASTENGGNDTDGSGGNDSGGSGAGGPGFGPVVALVALLAVALLARRRN